MRAALPLLLFLAGATAQQMTTITLTHTNLVTDPVGGVKTVTNTEVITVPVVGQGGGGGGSTQQGQEGGNNGGNNNGGGSNSNTNNGGNNNGNQGQNGQGQGQTANQPTQNPAPAPTQQGSTPPSPAGTQGGGGNAGGGGQAPPASQGGQQPQPQPQSSAAVPGAGQSGQAGGGQAGGGQSNPAQTGAQPTAQPTQAGSSTPGGTGVVPVPVPGQSSNGTVASGSGVAPPQSSSPGLAGNGTGVGTGNGTVTGNGTETGNGTVNGNTTTPTNTTGPPLNGVPSGVPIEGNYTGPYRPQSHFTPPQGFMNDPNGLFRDNNGTWHLYYQYNPSAVVPGNQHWGHATSANLTQWENQPIALYPPEQDVGVFSGSIVMDPNNTSGFFPNANNGVVAIYTLHYPNGTEVQAIASSNDTGYTFTPQGTVLNTNSTDFRDPKVIRAADKWVMAVARSANYTVEFYTSTDLKAWELASNFSHGGVLSQAVEYECPNLVQLPLQGGGSTWVLLLSINPGAPLGGSTTQYFPGDFNGTHFTPVDAGTRFLEWTKDAYAGQFFYTNTSDAGTEPGTLINWAGNWQYAEQTPTANESWRGAMSLARTVEVSNTSGSWDLVQTPIFTQGTNISTGSSTNGSLAVTTPLPSTAIYLSLKLNNITANATGTLNWTFSNADELLQGGYFLNKDMWLDRGGVRNIVDPLFNNKFSTRPNVKNGSLELQVVFDRSIVEIFADGAVGTSVVYPAAPLTNVGVWADVPNGVGVDVGIYEVVGGIQAAAARDNAARVDSAAAVSGGFALQTVIAALVLALVLMS